MPKRFTKKQLEVMKILWASPEPMIASEIVKQNEDLNINTVQACLRSLIKDNAIEVSDIVYSGTVLTRSYTPVITKEAYFGTTYQDIVGSEKSSSVFEALIGAETDVGELDKMEKLIKKRKSELSKK